MKTLLAMLVVILFAAGCSDHRSESKIFSELYPAETSKISKIEIRNSATFLTKTVTDEEVIKSWLEIIKNLKFTVDPSQEPRTGYAFSVVMYEGDQQKLKFYSNKVGDTYYILQDDLLKAINNLYESSKD